MTEHEKFMKKAIEQARKARDNDEVPVGAIIVKNGKIIARAYNMREKTNDPTAHAEIIAIRKACHKMNSWRLEDCVIYVTLEPCSMCAGALIWTRMKKIVFGACDPKGGALGSSYNIIEQKGINHFPEVHKEVLHEECSRIIRDFFSKKRNKME